MLEIPNSYFLWPYQVASAEGWLAQAGIQLDFNSTFDYIPALLGGSADIIGGGGYDIVTADSKGADIIEIGVMSNHPVQFILTQPAIKDPAQLQGKTFGMTSLVSGDAWTSRQFLIKRGVDPSKVTFKPVGGSRERFAALEAGQIDASPMDPFIVSTPAANKYNILATPQDFADFPWNVLAAKRDWASANRDLVTAVVRAGYRGMKFIQDPGNEDKVASDLQGAKWDPAAVKALMQLLKDHKVKMYDDIQPDQQQLQNSVAYLNEINAVKGSPDVSKMVDSSYYQAAISGL